MNAQRDILNLKTLSVMEPSTVSPDLWEDLGMLPDLHPSFGWNVPRPTYSDAVGLGLAVQCAAVKARDIAKSGMVLWLREARRWTEVEPRDHWFARFLARRPNSMHTWGDFWRMTVMHLELSQNAYIYKRINQRGELLELVPLQPARVRKRVTTTDRLVYEINAATEFERMQLGAQNIVVSADRIIHIKGKLLDGLTGLPNTTVGNPLFDLLNAISSYQTTLFGNDGTSPLVFETDSVFSGELADAAFRRLKQQLAERVRKANRSGDPILLEAGLKAKPIAANARDSMTVEAYKQTVGRICGLMEIPPHKIFHFDDGAKYSNTETLDNQYASDCLIPAADNIEENLRNSLLPEDEWDTYWPEFDRERMTAADAKAINERVKIAVMCGTMMINEARERWGLNPVDGGDRFLVPVNMSMMDENGEIIQQAATGQTSGNQGTQNAPEADDANGPRLAVDNT